MGFTRVQLDGMCAEICANEQLLDVITGRQILGLVIGDFPKAVLKQRGRITREAIRLNDLDEDCIVKIHQIVSSVVARQK